MSQRTSRLLAVLEEQGLPAMLITSPINIAYLSGFTGSHGAVLVTPAESFVLTDSRYVLQAGDESPGFAVCQLVEPGKEIADWLVELAGRLGFDQCGFEADHLTSAGHAALAQGLAGRLELHPTAGVVEGLRMLKDAAELDAMRRAIDLTDQVMDAVLPQLRPSHTERQAAWMLEQALREGGAERPSFPIIVAAGPNAALAHHRPGDECVFEIRRQPIDQRTKIGKRRIVRHRRQANRTDKNRIGVQAHEQGLKPPFLQSAKHHQPTEKETDKQCLLQDQSLLILRVGVRHAKEEQKYAKKYGGMMREHNDAGEKCHMQQHHRQRNPGLPRFCRIRARVQAMQFGIE